MLRKTAIILLSSLLSLAIALWLVSREAALVWVVNHAAQRSAGQFATMNGVYLFENLNFDAPANDGVFQAAFFFSPLPIKGATGSPGNPILIV